MSEVQREPQIDAAEAVERLVEFGVRCALEEGHVRQARGMVSRSGARWKVEANGDDPEAILDATALLSHYVSLDSSKTTGITSESVMQARQTYAKPKRHASFLAAERLLLPYGGELSGGLV